MTAIFATCGLGFIPFVAAALLSLPKQLATVYVGVALQSTHGSQADKKSRIVTGIVLFVTVVVTLFAMWYITKLVNRAKVEVVEERRQARFVAFLFFGFCYISS